MIRLVLLYIFSFLSTILGLSPCLLSLDLKSFTILQNEHLKVFLIQCEMELVILLGGTHKSKPGVVSCCQQVALCLWRNIGFRPRLIKQRMFELELTMYI